MELDEGAVVVVDSLALAGLYGVVIIYPFIKRSAKGLRIDSRSVVSNVSQRGVDP
jgi:hypothetical protein